MVMAPLLESGRRCACFVGVRRHGVRGLQVPEMKEVPVACKHQLPRCGLGTVCLLHAIGPGV